MSPNVQTSLPDASSNARWTGAEVRDDDVARCSPREYSNRGMALRSDSITVRRIAGPSPPSPVVVTGRPASAADAAPSARASAASVAEATVSGAPPWRAASASAALPCPTCATSCASSASPRGVPGAYRPAPKTTCRPKAYASAPTARADSAARASACTRASAAAEPRPPRKARVGGSSGAPGEESAPRTAAEAPSESSPPSAPAPASRDRRSASLAADAGMAGKPPAGEAPATVDFADVAGRGSAGARIGRRRRGANADGAAPANVGACVPRRKHVGPGAFALPAPPDVSRDGRPQFIGEPAARL